MPHRRIAIRTSHSSQLLSHPDHHLIPESTLDRLTKPTRPLTHGTMSGATPISRRVLPRGRRAEISNEELRARRHAGDFSQLAPILPEGGCLLSSVPDCNKDLPRIPSTSTELWGAEIAAILTEQMDSLMKFSFTDFADIPKHSRRAYERVPSTKSQRIAAQYRQRHQTSPPTSETFDKGILNVGTDAPVESSLEHRETGLRMLTHIAFDRLVSCELSGTWYTDGPPRDGQCATAPATLELTADRPDFSIFSPTD